MEESKAKVITKSEHPQDRVSKTRTMYDAGIFEIFFKNLIAGFARAIGGLLIYGVFILIVSSLVSQLFLPQLKPLLQSYQQALNNFNRLGDLSNPSNNSESSPNTYNLDELIQDPNVQQFLQQYQQSQN